MTTRHAIIIESSQTKHGYLPGAAADAKAYKDFLLSPSGGFWRDYEVTVLHTPTKSALMNKLHSISTVDYAIITFSGHGEHHVSKTLNDTSICLNDYEEVYVKDLDPTNDRLLRIIDCCRELRKIDESTQASTALRFLKKSMVDPERLRHFYSEQIASSPKGSITMYSCDINETAGEDSNGGYFSKATVDCANQWAQRYSGKGLALLDSKRDFDMASITTKSKEPRQNPAYNGGRRITHYPWAVTM